MNAPTPAPGQAPIAAPRQLTLGLVQAPRPSFDNFVAGRNVEALSALRALPASGKPALVYLWGEVGSGRSHLLTALAASARVTAVNDGAVPAFAAGVTGYVVDDVDRCNDAGQQQLFMLINEVRAQPGAWLVAAGPAPPSQLPFRPELTTRLAWGLVYQLHALTDDEKAQALVAHARSRGTSLPAEVVSYLLKHLPRDMRTLVAVVDAVDDYALSLQRPVTVPLVREWTQNNRGAA